MRVAVVGSRHYPDLRRVRNFVRELPHDTVVVSGGAIGVDRMAERAAKEAGLGFDVYLPDYERHGRKAPFVRNAQIVDACDRVVAFWDGESRGTQNVINLGKMAQKPVYIVDPQGNSMKFLPSVSA